MTRLKYLDPADGLYKLLPVGGGGSEEVVISAGVAPALNEELWVDTSGTQPIYDWSYADNRYLLNGFRNVIRNGDMSIAQRGDGPFTTGNKFTLDGWRFNFASGATSISRVPQGTGLSKWLSAAVSGQSGATAFAVLIAPIEGVGTLAGKTVTLSFDALAASGTPKIGVEVFQHFGTGGTPAADATMAVGTVTLGTTKTRYVLTFTMPSVAGKGLGTSGTDRLEIFFWLSAGTNYASNASGIGIQNNTFSITDVQLEEGSAMTPFERIPQQQQLAWCQRYFYRFPDPSEPSGRVAGVGYGITATSAQIMINYPVPFRISPTFTLTGAYADLSVLNATNNTNIVCSAAPSINNGGIKHCILGCSVASGLSLGGGARLIVSTTNTFLDFSSEL